MKSKVARIEATEQRIGPRHAGLDALRSGLFRVCPGPLSLPPAYHRAMARKKIVTLIDDLDGTEASETVTFAIDGSTYEIDLSERNAAALREVLRRYTTAAREAGTQGHTGRNRVTIPSTGHSRNAEIRAWAHSNGHAVPARGRIPQRVVAAFDASH